MRCAILVSIPGTGVRIEALIDTGSDSSLLDALIAEKLPLQYPVTQLPMPKVVRDITGNDMQVSGVIQRLPLCFGGTETYWQSIDIIPNNGLNGRMVIGQDLLYQYRAKISYEPSSDAAVPYQLKLHLDPSLNNSANAPISPISNSDSYHSPSTTQPCLGQNKVEVVVDTGGEETLASIPAVWGLDMNLREVGGKAIGGLTGEIVPVRHALENGPLRFDSHIIPTTAWITDIFGDRSAVVIGRDWLRTNYATIEYLVINRVPSQQLSVKMANETVPTIIQSRERLQHLHTTTERTGWDDAENVPPIQQEPVVRDVRLMLRSAATTVSLLRRHYRERLDQNKEKVADYQLPPHAYPLTEATLTIPFAVTGSPVGGTAKVTMTCGQSFITQAFARKLENWTIGDSDDDGDSDILLEQSQDQQHGKLKELAIYFTDEDDAYPIDVISTPTLPDKISLLIAADFLYKHNAIVDLELTAARQQSRKARWLGEGPVLKLRNPVISRATAPSAESKTAYLDSPIRPSNDVDGTYGMIATSEGGWATAMVAGQPATIGFDLRHEQNFTSPELATYLRQHYSQESVDQYIEGENGHRFKIEEILRGVPFTVGNLCSNIDLQVLSTVEPRSNGIVMGRRFLKEKGAKVVYNRPPYDAAILLPNEISSTQKRLKIAPTALVSHTWTHNTLATTPERPPNPEPQEPVFEEWKSAGHTMESLVYSGDIFLSKLVGVTDELPTTIMPTETVCVVTEELGRILGQHYKREICYEGEKFHDDYGSQTYLFEIFRDVAFYLHGWQMKLDFMVAKRELTTLTPITLGLSFILKTLERVDKPKRTLKVRIHRLLRWTRDTLPYLAPYRDPQNRKQLQSRFEMIFPQGDTSAKEVIRQDHTETIDGWPTNLQELTIVDRNDRIVARHWRIDMGDEISLALAENETIAHVEGKTVRAVFDPSVPFNLCPPGLLGEDKDAQISSSEVPYYADLPLTHEALDDTYMIKVNAIVEPTAKYRGEDVIVLGLPHAMRVALERKQAIYWKERHLDQISSSSDCADDGNSENESEGEDEIADRHKIWMGDIIRDSTDEEMSPLVLASSIRRLHISNEPLRPEVTSQNQLTHRGLRSRSRGQALTSEPKVKETIYTDAADCSVDVHIVGTAVEEVGIIDTASDLCIMDESTAQAIIDRYPLESLAPHLTLLDIVDTTVPIKGILRRIPIRLNSSRLLFYVDFHVMGPAIKTTKIVIGADMLRKYRAVISFDAPLEEGTSTLARLTLYNELYRDIGLRHSEPIPPETIITVGSIETRVHIDTGLEATLVSEPTLDEVDMKIDEEYQIALEGVTGTRATILGTLKELPIKFDSNTVETDCVVTDVFGEEDVLVLGRQWLWENRATIEYCGVGNEAYQKLTVRPDEYNLENSTTIILRRRTKKEANLLAPPPTPILDDEDHLRPAPRPIEVPTSCERLTYEPMPTDEIDVAAKAALISMSMPKTYDERIKFTHQRQTRLGLPLDVVPLDEPNYTIPFGIAGADIIDTARVRIHAKGSYIAEDLAKRIVSEPTLWEEEQPNLPGKDRHMEVSVSVKIPIYFVREYDFSGYMRE